MNLPKVFIIILNWNGLQNTLECLESVFKLNYENFEVVMVDNGSTDGSCKIIEKMYIKVRLIENGENLGYAGGNNVGIRYAMSQNAQYIWLLNNDTIVEKDCLKTLVAQAEITDSLGLASPVVYYYDNPYEIQFAGSYMNWKDISLNYLTCVKQGLNNDGDLCLWGTALLLKGQLVENIGYLKEEYFAYWEDVEYSLRSIKAGFKNIVCQSAKIYHKNKFHQEDNNKKGEAYHYFMSRNRVLLGNEYFKSPIKRSIFKIRLFASLSDYVQRCGKQNIDPIMDGSWQGIKGMNGPMTNRKRMPSSIKKSLVLISKLHPIFLADLLTLRLSDVWRKMSKRHVMRLDH